MQLLELIVLVVFSCCKVEDSNWLVSSIAVDISRSEFNLKLKFHRNNFEDFLKINILHLLDVCDDSDLGEFFETGSITNFDAFYFVS